MSTAKHVLQEAHKATNGNSSADILLPKSYQDSIWERFKGILPHRENLIVAGREVKGGIVIHPIIATAILGVIITIGLGIRSEMNWQHDQLVKMTTQKEESDKHDAEYRAETKSTLAVYKVYIDNLREKQIASDAKRSKN